MIHVGERYQPTWSNHARNGKQTLFSVPQMHMGAQGNEYDGYITVIADGLYDWVRGDSLEIKSITGAGVRSRNGKNYYSLFCEIEYMPLQVARARQNIGHIEHDIAEDL